MRRGSGRPLHEGRYAGVAVGSEVGLLVGASDGLVKRLERDAALRWRTMDREAARAIEWDCTQTLTRFFNSFDQWRYDDMAACSRRTGCGIGKANRSRARRFVAALNTRSRTQTVRPLYTKVQIDVADASTRGLFLYVTAYMHDSGTKPTKPANYSVALSVAGRAGPMVKCGEDWKVASMSMNREFEF